MAAGLFGGESRVMFVVFRDVIQVAIIGIIVPFLLNSKEQYDLFEAGIRFDHPLRYLAVGVVLGALLFVQFLTDGQTTLRAIDSNAISGAVYVIAMNLFEVIFFACFLRHQFEKAFGIIPAIVLASVAYSLHHAGFQPEYLKLFFVGVFFLSIFRIANHWLVLFPLWWVGGLGDVLFRSSETAAVDWGGAWIRGVLILALVVFELVWNYPQLKSKRITAPSSP